MKKFNRDEILLQISEGLKEASSAPNIKKYVPHEKQRSFHCSICKKKLYIGGNRSGKTTGGVTEGIWRATCTHPYRPELNLKPSKGRVIGVDFDNGIDKILIPQYKQWTPRSVLRGGTWESAFDKTGRVLNFTNGSTIEFMSYSQDLDKFAGTSRDWIHFDEEPPHPIYVENMARLIDTDGEYWITMTPVEGITWVYDELYEPNYGKEDSDVLIIEINTLENPYLSVTAIKSFLGSVDDDEVTARIQGEFVQVGGRIYKNFDPTPGGRHVLTEPFDEPKIVFRDWLWICALDHGLNNPTAVLWIAIDKQGFGVVFDEWYQNEWTIDQHAAKIKQKIKSHGRLPDIFVADPSIVNRNAITNTSVQQEYQKYGLSFIPGNNDVKAGIIRVKKYWNLTPYVGKKEGAFAGETDKFPMLRVTPNCTNLIHEHKRYRWKTFTNKKLAYENNPYDEPHKKDDHTCDALRYGLMTQPDLFAENNNLGEKVDDILSKITLPADMGSAIFTRAIGTERHADPQGLREPGSQWREGNDIPKTSGAWEYDEHMGGLY